MATVEQVALGCTENWNVTGLVSISGVNSGGGSKEGNRRLLSRVSSFLKLIERYISNETVQPLSLSRPSLLDSSSSLRSRVSLRKMSVTHDVF